MAKIAAGQGLLRGPGHQDDAGQALRQGVVDFAGQAFALGGDAGFVLGPGQLGPGPPELVRGQPLRFPLQVQRAVGQPGDHGEPGTQDRTQDHRQGG